MESSRIEGGSGKMVGQIRKKNGMFLTFHYGLGNFESPKKDVEK